MLNLNSILVFSDNPKQLEEFYEKVFGQNPGWRGGDFVGWQVGNSYFMVGPHGKVHGKSSNPERIMFNFETEDVDGEFKKLKDAGVTVVREPYQPDEARDMWIATFADPDGNYFQIATPMDASAMSAN